LFFDNFNSFCVVILALYFVSFRTQIAKKEGVEKKWEAVKICQDYRLG